MATYGRAFYGDAKYGRQVDVVFDVRPFTAICRDYGTISVRWSTPQGGWTDIRLIRSKTGPASHENDGLVLIDDTNDPGSYIDTFDIVGGRWYYYTVFLKTSTGWIKTQTTSVLATAPLGSGNLMWSRLPEFYRSAQQRSSALTESYQAIFVNDRTDYDVENQHLRQFIRVLGFGMDQIITHQRVLGNSYDPYVTHHNNLDQMARQFGIQMNTDVPAAVNRSRVAFAAIIARRRGTLRGVREAAALTSGYNIDFDVSPNRLLSGDQSEFRNPVFPQWNPGTRYLVDDIVQFQGNLFKAKANNAGEAQKPSDVELNNTWWDIQVNASHETFKDSVSNSLHNWKAYTGTTEVALSLAVGISTPIDNSEGSSNALSFKNTSGSTKTYKLWGVPTKAGQNTVSGGSADPRFVISKGVPLDKPVLWTVDGDYTRGDIVREAGIIWRARQDTIGDQPSATPIVWDRLGVDERPKIGVSGYVHGEFDGGATGSAIARVGLACYDQHGNLLREFGPPDVWERGVVLDTFNGLGNAIAGRTPDMTFNVADPYRWVENAGDWEIWDFDNDNRVAYPQNYDEDGKAVVTMFVPDDLTIYNVGVTFGAKVQGARSDGLLLRYLNEDNYVRVTRTGVHRRIDGEPQTLHTWTSPIGDDTRIVVKINDDTNTFTINAPQAVTGTLPAGTAPYRHGFMVRGDA